MDFASTDSWHAVAYPLPTAVHLPFCLANVRAIWLVGMRAHMLTYWAGSTSGNTQSLDGSHKSNQQNRIYVNVMNDSHICS